MTDPTQCPCGGGPYAGCCGPLHAGDAQATAAEALMRSRYSAFALGLPDHLWRTWHPRTRPERVTVDSSAWTGLEIIDVVDGGEHDSTGVVEFIAHYRDGRRPGRLHERSQFERRAGRWMYVDGDLRP